MLYACGVGARPYEDLNFLFEGKGPKVLPTFAVIGGMAGHGRHGPARGHQPDADPSRLARRSPCTARSRHRARSRCRASSQSSGTRARLRSSALTTTATDKDGPLFSATASIFARGSGGFGGERGPSTKGVNAPPERAPDHTISDETRFEQAAIYRLSGDRNPLHIDPEFAKVGGFDTPILHGLCTYGFVGRAILKAVCGNDPANFKSFDARFTDVVFPGDTIITKLWVDGKEAIVHGRDAEGQRSLVWSEGHLRLDVQQGGHMTTTIRTELPEVVRNFLNGRPKQLFIDGAFVDATDGLTFDTIDPATEQVLAQVALGSKQDVDRAVKAARTAFEDGRWRDLPPRNKEAILRKLADLIEANATEIGTVETLDNGKPLQMGIGEARGAAETFRYYSGWPTKIIGTSCLPIVEVQLRPSRAGRCLWTDHPVELPADHGRVEDRAGARVREHSRA